MIDRSFKFHSHIRRRVGLASGLTNNFLSSTLCRESDFLINIYKSLIRPQMEYGSSLWNQGYLGDLRLLERVQKRWTRAVVHLEAVPYRERLLRLGLFSFQGRLLRNDLVVVWKILHNKCAIDPDEIFTFDTSFRTRGHNMKIFLPRFRLDVRKRYFSVRVVSSWNSLAQETVSAQSLETFKCLLHRDLGDLLYSYND